MKHIRLRPKAISDLAGIRRYTKKIWGLAQARIYLNEFDERFGAIASGTALSVTVSAEGRSFERCRHNEHLIFFVETSEAVEIVRVLHPRMNIVAKLRDA